MKDLAPIVGHNLAELRKAKNMTQEDLAQRFNYTDKSISKWERGETLPDLGTLLELADFFGVTLDYLTHEQSPDSLEAKGRKNQASQITNKIITASLAVVFVWTLATVIFVGFLIVPDWQNMPWRPWMAFVWAVPLSFLVLIAFNRQWGLRGWGAPLKIAFVWSFALSVYLEIGFDYAGKGWSYWFVLLAAVPLTIFFLLQDRLSKN
jgi:transcriptional regulator with XRE-family HTH domain